MEKLLGIAQGFFLFLHPITYNLSSVYQNDYIFKYYSPNRLDGFLSFLDKLRIWKLLLSQPVFFKIYPLNVFKAYGRVL